MGLCLRFHGAIVVLLWLLVLAPDFPLFGMVIVKKQASMDRRSFQADTCCHLYLLSFFSFLHSTVFVNYFCPTSENMRCRSYSFNVQIFLWNLLYKTEALVALQRFCYHVSCLPVCSARGAVGAALFCRLWHRLGTAAGAWEPFKDRCQPWRALPSLPCTHQHLWEVSVWLRGRHRNKYRMGKGTGKRKIAGLEGEGEKWPRKGIWRQTERQTKNCFPFYEEREPSNQYDWVQLFRPLYTHELAIKCGSGKQKTS